jgi:hypothetical protein
LAQSGQHEQASELLHTAHDHCDTLSTTGSLRDLDEVFTFSTARQHYYNAATSAHMHDWKPSNAKHPPSSAFTTLRRRRQTDAGRSP